MDKQTNDIFVTLVILALVVFTVFTVIDDASKPEPQPFIEGIINDRTRGLDYQNSTIDNIIWHEYTDSDIRDIRNNNPNLIIKVPGRIILSVEEEFEERLEEYIEDNPELLEDYLDNQ